MATVTYLGPLTPADPSDLIQAILPPAPEDGPEAEAQIVTFRRDQPTYDVPEWAVAQIADARGHAFEILASSDAEAKRLERAAAGEEGEETAEVTVELTADVEPWEGYSDLTVEEIEPRLREAALTGDTGLLDRVRSYEQAHDARKGVLEFDPESVSTDSDE